MSAKLLATDETLEKVSENLKQIAGFLGVMAASDLDQVIADPHKLHELIQSGDADKVLSIGDQIVVPHADYGNIVFDIVGFDHDADATGLHKHSISIVAHDIIAQMMFDQRENEVATESHFSADYSYYEATANADVFKYLTPGVDYQIGAAIPGGKTYYHSAIEDKTGNIVRYGYNNWEHSAIRQYLNSDKDKGTWWSPKHLGDVAPDYATTKDGFLKGFDADFRSIIGTTKKVTALNTVTDGGGSVELIEKIFLLSRTEVSGGNENNVAEGKVYPYFEALVGSVTTAANSGRIKYLKSGAVGWWGLRAPVTGNSCTVRYCAGDGTVSNFSAGIGDRGLVPACILV